jgi:hypothetical protein
VRRQPFRPGDQVTLASGRKVVLSRKRDDGSWLAQYIEDAEKQSDVYIVVPEKDLPQ